MGSVAGFVLAGGRSSRMGRDKALMPWHGSTLLETAVAKVREAAGNAAILGSPELYGHLGFPVLADRVPDCGPLAGLDAALAQTRAEWNLILACDMPLVTTDLLGSLLRSAEGDAVVPRIGGSWEPLCAIYHRRLAPEVESALLAKSLKMQDFVSRIDARPWPVSDPSLFTNVNRLHEFEAVSRR